MQSNQVVLALRYSHPERVGGAVKSSTGDLQKCGTPAEPLPVFKLANIEFSCHAVRVVGVTAPKQKRGLDTYACKRITKAMPFNDIRSALFVFRYCNVFYRF